MAINIVLHEPEIPHNTGAIGRTCVLTDTKLHIIKPLGFDIDDRSLKRAGLDYWHLIDLTIYENTEDFFDKNKNINFYLASTKTDKKYCDIAFKDEDFIIFGKETAGIPDEMLKSFPDRVIRIPMRSDLRRSLNLANSVNIILYEALRQLNFLSLV